MATRNGKKKLAKKLATPKPEPAKPTLIPQPNGKGALLSGGVPGHDGSNAGRPPKAWRKFCRELVSSPEYQQAIQAAATNATNPNFMGAAKLAAEYGSRKPEKTIRHAGTVDVNVTSVRERLAERIARLAQRN